MRTGKRDASSFWEHVRPKRLSASALKLSSTFCLGGLSFFTFMIEAVTGTLLLFYYEPGAKAFASVGVITNLTPYGSLIRGLHFWAGQIMVITVLLHMARVVWHQAYRPPREKNWVIGVVLFCLTLILDFSGYLLRGSQESGAAATVARSLLESLPGGDVPARMFLGPESWQGSSPALYVWHVFLLAGLAFFLQIWHFWRVRRDGGVRPL